jgi:hypothetical protein
LFLVVWLWLRVLYCLLLSMCVCMCCGGVLSCVAIVFVLLCAAHPCVRGVCVIRGLGLLIVVLVFVIGF